MSPPSLTVHYSEIILSVTVGHSQGLSTENLTFLSCLTAEHYGSFSKDVLFHVDKHLAYSVDKCSLDKYHIHR